MTSPGNVTSQRPLISPDIQRRMTTLLSLKPSQGHPRSSSVVSRSIRPGTGVSRASVVSDMSYIGEQRQPSIPTSHIQPHDRPTLNAMQSAAVELVAICDKAGGDKIAPGFRHRLEQISTVINELRPVLSDHHDDRRLQKALAQLRQAMTATKMTLDRAQGIWFRRRSRFKDPVRGHIDDLNDAFARVRIAAVQVRSRPLPVLTPLSSHDNEEEEIMTAESTCLLADKYIIGRMYDMISMDEDSVDTGHGVPKCTSTAKRLYEESAALGYVPAMNCLGMLYRDGIGMGSRDTASALEWLTKASSLGSIDATNNLGELQMDLATSSDDVSRAIELFEMAASAGEPLVDDESLMTVNLMSGSDHAAAATTLGWFHENGSPYELIDRDVEIAEQWYRIAASVNYSTAQNNLGCLLYNRALTEKSDEADNGRSQRRLEEAIRLFQYSADQGNASAMNSLGICHEMGHGVPQDVMNAERLYTRAALAGNGHACANIGRLMLDHHRYNDARHWFYRAIDSSIDAAKGIGHAYLGFMYQNGSTMGLQQCMTTAYDHYAESARLGNARGQFYAGQCCYSGAGTDQDTSRAFHLYKQSALQAYPDGQNAIAMMLEEGIPYVQDFTQALYWYKKAANQSHSEAIFNIGCLYENGSGVDINLTKAIEYYQQAASKGNLQAAVRLVQLQNQS